MTFDDILDQAIEMLQRRGRLTYRTLKRQFHLDDETLEDLTFELIEGQRLANDENGTVLVWTGETGSPQPDAQRGTKDERHFQVLLPAVMALLRQEGRVTYRAIKYIFGIDDALLDEIRKELSFRQVVRDESGEGLVWIGETQAVTAPGVDVSSQPFIADTTEIASPAAPTPFPATEPNMPSNGPTVPTEVIATDAQEDEPIIPSEPTRTAPKAERRQLTVMFCDLADSTKLSQQLDPEDLREVIRAYQQTSAEVIQRFDGYIAQHLGDGLLMYFGWPRAHEDDAQRALHAFLPVLRVQARPKLDD